MKIDLTLDEIDNIVTSIQQQRKTVFEELSKMGLGDTAISYLKPFAELEDKFRNIREQAEYNPEKQK